MHGELLVKVVVVKVVSGRELVHQQDCNQALRGLVRGEKGTVVNELGEHLFHVGRSPIV